MTFNEFLEKVNGNERDIINYDTKEKALAAVKKDGLALQYVKEQTPEICLTAVQQNGHALEYVDKSIFS